MTGWLTFFVAVLIVLVFWRSWRTYSSFDVVRSQVKSQVKSQGETGSFDVTVIVPARNEEHQIGRLLHSLHDVEVIVVDDASTDRTAEIAIAAGAQVLHAPALAPGALGKPNACAAGARAADSRWLLFLDADTWFEPGFVPALVSYAEHQNLQMVTSFLRQECYTLAENILLPYAFALYFAGVNARRVNDSGSSESLANGQCLLIERDAYEQIGGHTGVIQSVIEDVALAQAAKRHRLRTRVTRAEHLGHVRMYSSFAAIWRGFEKNSFRFLLANPNSGWQVVIASILATSWLPLLAIGFADPASAMWPLVALFAAPSIALLPWYRAHQNRLAWRCLLAPAAIYLFQLVALNGMITVLTRRKTVWKERRV